MIKYRIDVADALERIGYNSYTAKKTGIISQETLKKLKNNDTRVTMDGLNRLCILLGMKLSDIIVFVEDPEEREAILNGFDNSVK